MGDPRGFLKIHRVAMPERDPRERVADHKEIFGVLPDEELKQPRARAAWTAASPSATTAARSAT